MPNKTKLTPEEVENGIEEYQKKCKDDNEPFTMTGLAVYLGVHEETLINYAERETFSSHIKKAKDIAKLSLINGGLTGRYNPTMAIFMAKVNHGMQDKQVVEQDTTINVKIFEN